MGILLSEEFFFVCTGYVVRYTGRPAIAQSRILDYDGSYVTYYYERHEDGKRIEEKIHVYEFIKLLIKHIPDKNFKVVRYYGIYAKEHKHSKKLIKLLNDIQIKNRNKKQSNNIQNFPFANEVKQLKENFKHSIDEMPDEDFIDTIYHFNFKKNLLFETSLSCLFFYFMYL